MSQLLDKRNIKIGIFGLGKTGVAAYVDLRNIATKIVCFDDNHHNRENFSKQYKGATIIDISDAIWQKLDFIIVSPGIASSHPIFEFAGSYNITITSDIDIFFEKTHQANFIAVTGTNGKSTTTSLITHILGKSGLDYLAGGNIGQPVLSLPTGRFGYVLELSSFQLELIKNFRTKISVLLNITQDHLDRHLTMENYINIKEKIISITDDYCIIGVNNSITNKIFSDAMVRRINSSLIPVSAHQRQFGGVGIVEDIIYDDISEDAPVTMKLPIVESLRGEHNKENLAAAYAACKLAGLSQDKILTAINSFIGLPHRMQYITTIKTRSGNINIYNDSKATNAEAAIKSISSLKNIHWLAGGIAKIGGIEEISPWFSRITKAYLFGQDKELFAKALDGKVEYVCCEDLEEAIDRLFDKLVLSKKLISAKYDQNILLAPAASSYDQFRNFEHRGERFIELCQKKLQIYAKDL